jgi:hypothetical protein
MEKNKLYPWKRYWLLFGSTYTYDHFGFPSFHEYSLDSGEQIRKTRSLSELSEIKCLILLGEPGSGKTTEAKNAKHDNAFNLTYELNTCSTELELFSGITSCNLFRDWLDSDDSLYLYLDGFDEALLNIKTIRNSLISWLNRNKEDFNIIPVESQINRPYRKFFLRITCRSAIWSDETTNKLESLFGPSNVKVYELAPLTRSDVVLAAKINSFNEQDFINTIRDRELIPFTGEPFVLKFLIESYKSGKLSEDTYDKVKLFHDGSIHLATEINEMYKPLKVLTPEERIRIAGRVATYVQICNKNKIWTDEITTEVNQEDLVLHDILNDNFGNVENKIQINLKSIKETLNSALFSPHNNVNRIIFKHRSYGEFLAAMHLNEMQITNQLVQQLLTSPFDKFRAIPQIEEVIVWLATMNEKTFFLFLDSEPLLMLKVSKKFTQDERKMLVDSILKSANEFESIDSYDGRKFYIKLQHSDLGEQLLPYLEKGKNIVVKRTAIDIAGACRTIDLLPSLVKILNNQSENYYVRKEVINAISEIGERNQILELRKFVLTDIVEDIDDEFKGAAFKVLYPEFLSTTEMVVALTPLKRNNLYGAYHSFIDSVGDLIPVSDFETAIKSLIENDSIFNRRSNNQFENLLKRLLSRSWKVIEKSVTVSTMASFLLRFYKNNFHFEVTEDDYSRRLIAKEIIFKHYDSIEYYEIAGRTGRSTRLISNNDFSWLVDLIKTTTDGSLIDYMSNVMRYIFDHNDARATIDFFEIAFAKPEVMKNYEGWFKAIDLDSELAVELRKEHTSNKESLEVVEEYIDETYSAGVNQSREYVIKHLDKFEAGDLSEWWRLIMALGSDNGDGYFLQNDFEFDITKLKGWNILDNTIKQRIENGCRIYLNQYKELNLEWINTNEYSRPELAGYKALVFLLRTGDTYIDSLPLEFWKKWHSVIFYCVVNQHENKNQYYQKLLIKCHSNSKELFPSTIEKYFKIKISQGKSLYELYKLEDIIDDGIAEALLQIIVSPHIQGNELIIDLLFSKKIKKVREYSWHQFNLLLQGESLDQELGLYCSAALLQNPYKDEWDFFWRKLIKENQLAKKIFLRQSNAFSLKRGSSLMDIAPKQLASLLIWLYRNFPPEEDPLHDTAYSPSARDNIRDLRSVIIKNLIETGSIESVDAMRYAATKIHDRDDFRWWLLSAREFMRKNTWTPLKTSELRTLFHNFNKRVVRNEYDLLIVIEESLNRLQKKMQGDNPTSFFLWDRISANRFKPKDENSLSDFIKMHLDYELREQKIIINREVEIKRSTGRRDGQRTDLYIQALSADPAESFFTVVIEVKGCWNGELKTAMETQLRNRYLSKHKSSHGIYIVGWYVCSHYNTKNIKGTKRSMQLYLMKQAENLANGVYLKSMVLDCTI